MKTTFILSILMFCWLFCEAQSNENPETSICGMDSITTNHLLISTGITGLGASDSALFSCGYGGNTSYPIVNTNVDTFWTVTRISSVYNPRPIGPAAYTGPYLSIGGNPFIICATGNPVQGYYSIFESDGTCSNNYTNAASQYLSVYSDAGGQNADIENVSGDGYDFSRCFFMCSEDTVNVNIKILADDIVDSVFLDNYLLYTTSNSGACCNFYCGDEVSINTNQFLSAGRHSLRIVFRDNLGGHIALSVFGAVNTVSGLKKLIRSRYDSKCEATIQPTTVKGISKEIDFDMSPNPFTGPFTVFSSQDYFVEITDIAGRSIYKSQQLSKGRTILNLNAAKGVYILTLKDKHQKSIGVKKIVVE